MKAAPVRTCVGCREATAPADLVRLVVAPDGTVVPDLAGKLPGRGAWVHLRPACLSAAPRALPRAMKGKVDASALEQRVRDAVQQALQAGLSLAAAGGGVVGGRSAVEEALRQERAVWVLLADDAAERTERGLRAAAGEVPITTLPMTTEALGHATGKAPRAVLAVLDASCSVHLRRQLRRLRSLG